MKEKQCQAVDLLTGTKLKLKLERDTMIPVSMEPRGGVVLKIRG